MWQWKRSTRRLNVLAAACILAVASGCAGAAIDDDASDLIGKVTIDGSSTVQPISTAAAESFLIGHPLVSIPVATSGTGGGFKKFVRGELDISNASRPISASEFAQCRVNGAEFVEIPIALDGLTIIVNPANDFVTELTVEEIKRIYLEKDAAKTWRNVRSTWPEEPISVFSPGTDSGTFDYFREVLGGKEVAMRSDMQVSEDDNTLVQGVERERYAIGYFGAAYFAGAEGRLKAVPIVNPKTKIAVAATDENVLSGEYFPFSRPLFIYVNRKSLQHPATAFFVEHYLENAADLARSVGYFPLPKTIADRAQANVKSMSAGTHFLTADGKPRRGPFSELFIRDNLVNIK